MELILAIAGLHVHALQAEAGAGRIDPPRVERGRGCRKAPSLNPDLPPVGVTMPNQWRVALGPMYECGCPVVRRTPGRDPGRPPRWHRTAPRGCCSRGASSRPCPRRRATRRRRPCTATFWSRGRSTSRACHLEPHIVGRRVGQLAERPPAIVAAIDTHAQMCGVARRSLVGLMEDLAVVHRARVRRVRPHSSPPASSVLVRPARWDARSSP